jgi:hypothetical protein
MAHRAHRALLARCFSSSPHGVPPPPPPPPPSTAQALWNRLLPDNDPKLREYKEREARVIKEQLTRSKFVEAARAGGRDKLFTAGPELLAPEAPFPEATLTSVREPPAPPLGTAELFSGAHATVVTLAFQGSSQAQLVPWHNGLWEALAPGTGGYAAPPSAGARAHGGAVAPLQLVNVLYLQGWVWQWGLVARAVAHGTRAALPQEVVEATYLALQPSAREADHFCDRLRVHNRVMGHVLLVDRAGHVRWRAHGLPGEGEVAALVEATRTLVAVGSGEGGARGRRGGSGSARGGSGAVSPPPFF